MEKGDKTALVLGAGGILGAFQAGALSVVLEDKAYAPDAIFGSSAGALNGAFLADRAGRASGPTNWSNVAEALVAFWKANITHPGAIWRQRGEIEIGSQICSDNFRGLLKTEADPPSVFTPRPRPLFRDIVRREIKRDNLITTKNRRTFYSPGTVDMFTSKIEYPPPTSENIIDLIIASSAIPIAMDCVITRSNDPDHPGDHPFIDGGTRDVAPLSRALKDGYQKIVCIACQSQELKYREFPPRRLADSMARTMSIVINETVNNDLGTIDAIKGLLKKSGLSRSELDETLKPYYDMNSVTVIRPEKEIDVDEMNFDSKKINDMINEGADTARRWRAGPVVFEDLKTAMEKSDPRGSFTIVWQS
jgi:NTE family protein